MTNSDYTATETEAIRRFTEDRIDPLTGKPWTLCGTSVAMIRGQASCGGCHQPVTLDADGLWIYG